MKCKECGADRKPWYRYCSVKCEIIARSIPDSNGCWIWQGSKGKNHGYGHQGGHMQAHRASYIAFVGEIPANLVVRHLCHVRLCVNPNHLRAGTQSENVWDGITDGRFKTVWGPGENHCRSKLTDDLVRKIRQDPRSQTQIAKELNLNQSTISLIKNRKAWTHVA